MPNWPVAIPQVLTALLLVQLFYGLTRTTWPAHYYDTSDIAASRISRTWYRYLLFRFGPVLLASAILAATSPADLGAEFLIALVFGFTHALITAGRSLAVAAIKQRLIRRTVLVDVFVFIGAGVASILGAVVAPSIRQYLPGLDKYVEVFLTGIVAAIAYSYVARWTTTAEPHIPAAVRLAVLPPDWLELTAAAAAQFRVDRDLALAVLLTEQSQRPDWIRALERRLGSRLARTHGPFQNMTDRSSTDAESINAAMENLANSVLPRRDGYMFLPGRLDYYIERHNRSDAFREMCRSLYYELSGEIPMADETGEDGTSTLRILQRQRVGTEWRLFGDVSNEVSAVGCVVPGATHRVTVVTVNAGRYHRKVWHLTLFLDDELAHLAPIRLNDGAQNPNIGSSVTVRLSY